MNRRRSNRVPMWRSVRLRLPCGQYSGRLRDLSSGGARVELAPAARLAFTRGSRVCLSIAVAPEFLGLKATVVRTSEESIGLAFEDLSEWEARQLLRLVEGHELACDVVIARLVPTATPGWEARS